MSFVQTVFETLVQALQMDAEGWGHKLPLKPKMPKSGCGCGDATEGLNPACNAGQEEATLVVGNLVSG